MERSKASPPPAAWLGQPEEDGRATRNGRIWVGRHTGDEDILVFDPAESESTAAVIELYSLTQHRARRFPIDTVRQRIEPISDQSAEAQAKKRYARRAELRAAHEESLAVAAEERRSRQRDAVVDAHRRFVDALGLEYQGVKESKPTRAVRTTPKCAACGIALDDFAGASCAICSRMLCSCGACGCGKSARRD
jgi:hypothetical protein